MVDFAVAVVGFGVGVTVVGVVRQLLGQSEEGGSAGDTCNGGVIVDGICEWIGIGIGVGVRARRQSAELRQG